jgi:hypothetical protein
MTFTSRKAASVALLMVLAPAGVAMAHTPYILPNTFDAERTRVTLQGALTEDDYFNPDIALNAPAYAETLPSGQQVQVTPTATLKDLTVTEAPLIEAGTYRFSTGALVTRKTAFAEVGGKWLSIRQPRRPRPDGDGDAAVRPSGPGPAAETPSRPTRGAGSPQGTAPDGDGPPTSIAEADVPADAKRMQVESVMIVETYVSKGAPTDTALHTSGHDLELKPITHPNAVYVDQGFAFQLLVDGQPAANVPVSVYRSGNIYDDRRIAVELKTDAKGNAKVAFSQPGVYLLTTHYPAAARAPGEAPPPRNYLYSLTFEVTR